MIKFIHIKKYEIGLRYYRGEFIGLVAPGKHAYFDLLGRTKIKVVNGRDVYLRDDDLDVIVKSGALAGKADVYELADMQRALVWIDGRFNAVLGPGLHVLWTGYRRVRVQVIDVSVTRPRLDHPDLDASALSDRRRPPGRVVRPVGRDGRDDERVRALALVGDGRRRDPRQGEGTERG